jgi:UDP-N-acetylglucosamine 2-epimerase
VAVAAFGISAYELAAAGVPTVLVLRQRSERWHAEHFAAAGAGVVVEQRPETIVDALQPLVVGAGLRRRFSQAAERFVDGRGTERVAELLTRLLSDRRKAERRGRAMPKRANNAMAGRPRDRARGVGRGRGPNS